MSDQMKTYEFRIRFLGNEILAVGFSTSNDSNRWLAAGLVTVFCVLTVLGAYGEKIGSLLKSFS